MGFLECGNLVQLLHNSFVEVYHHTADAIWSFVEADSGCRAASSSFRVVF